MLQWSHRKSAPRKVKREIQMEKIQNPVDRRLQVRFAAD